MLKLGRCVDGQKKESVYHKIDLWNEYCMYIAFFKESQYEPYSEPLSMRRIL